jgi:signal transduction histidine kinase
MATVSEIIERNHAEIMRCWTEQARSLASARGLAEPALQNTLPRYLECLCTPGDEERRARVESHFATRLRQGFLVTEIVEELALLGRCIARRWADMPPEERPEPADVDRLRDELHRASGRVVEMFVTHMREDEQIEKRYQRLLQDIATDALHGGAALRERLPEVLTIVQEALSAQCAAIMLLSGGELVTVAAVGVAAPASHTAALDGRSFAAEIARSDDAISIRDTESTELELPEALRHGGICSLIGVRLLSLRGLVGILYVGTTSPPPVAARAVRRLEALAQHLAVHLENASLVAELGAKIEALHTERSLREHFVSVLAHDLRGPLATAQLSIQLVQKNPELLRTRPDLATRVDRNLEQMDRMVRDLLDANRIRAGERLPLRLGECDLGPIAAQIAEDIRAQHGAHIAIEGEPHLRGIWSTDELQRALWNLVTNAVKYGAPQRPIAIGLHIVDERARVTVHNWGPPIPPEDQQSLFEPFARARAATRSGRPGWGLGLALVRGCAEAHGGTVSLESSLEAGTTFTLELPLDARPHQPADEVAPAER